MINSLELRIGNIILFNGEPIVVKGVLPDVVYLDGIVRQSTVGNGVEFIPILTSDASVQPLPLNDFLLEQMGRNRIVDRNGKRHVYYVRSSNFFIFKESDGYFIGMCNSVGPILITPGKFYYYHQLQNICFSQYGNEIDISEKAIKLAWSTAKNLGKI